jgi:hypothetical protein
MRRFEMIHLDDNKMQDYLDGNLNREESARVIRHLSVCPQCSARFKEYLEVYQMLATEKAYEISGLADQVMNRIQNDNPRKFAIREYLLTFLGVLAGWLVSLYFTGIDIYKSVLPDADFHFLKMDFSRLKDLYALFGKANFDYRIMAGIIFILIIASVFDQLILPKKGL